MSLAYWKERFRKSRRMRWTGNVACIGRTAFHTEFWWGNVNDRDNL